MATDMDIDMDFDVGLMEEDVTGPGIEIMHESEASVSSSLLFLYIDLTLLTKPFSSNQLRLDPTITQKTPFSPALKRYIFVDWTILQLRT